MSIGVVGDPYSPGSDYGGNGVKGWPYIVATRVDGIDVVVHNAAVKGAGYVHGNSRGVKFADEISDLTGGERVIVVAGSVNDRGAPPAELRSAALTVLRAMLQQAPNAAVVVIGPIWVGPPPGQRVLSLRDEVESAANELGLEFVDPIAERWFVDRPDLIGADGKHPTDEGHVYLADRIAPLIQRHFQSERP